MKTRPAPLGALVALAAIGGFERMALAAGCALSVEEDRGMVDRWPGIAAEVRTTLEARTDVETCAHVTLRSAPRTRVEVSLPDGRFASRDVSRREDVAPTVAALLLVPASPKLEDAVEAPVEPFAVPTFVTEETQPERPSEPLHRALAPTTTTRLGFELSALAGARVGSDQASLGGGLVSFLHLSGWLAGFGGRLDEYAHYTDERTTPALELALLAGRRMQHRSMAIDVLGGPAVAMLGSQADYEISTVEPQGRSIERKSSSAGTIPRAIATVRVVFGARSTFRTFLALDGEIGPRRAGGPSSPGDPELPLWTMGLALGGTVGTR